MQVYDMSVMRAAQRQPRRQLLSDLQRSKPLPARKRPATEEGPDPTK